MSKLRILMVNDFASTAYLFQKHLGTNVNAIYFYEHPAISLTTNPLFFKQDDIVNQVEQIKKLSGSYDIFIAQGWLASAICYLAGVNYIIYFLNGYIEPKYRLWKRMAFPNNYFYSKLFEDSLNSASKIVSSGRFFTKILKQYRKDIPEIMIFTDPEMFNPQAPKIDLGYNKFVFFSPQRIEEDKGQEIMWDIINNTKSDFVVLQVDWGSGNYYDKVILKKPSKVEIISKVKREKIPSYYVSADAVLGQISLNHSSSIERESILCGKPVFSYVSETITNDEPFHTGGKDLQKLAEHIDKIVTDEKYREELKKKQYGWVSNTFNNKETTIKWNEIFDYVSKNALTYKPKSRYMLALKLFKKIQRLN